MAIYALWSSSPVPMPPHCILYFSKVRRTLAVYAVYEGALIPIYAHRLKGHACTMVRLQRTFPILKAGHHFLPGKIEGDLAHTGITKTSTAQGDVPEVCLLLHRVAIYLVASRIVKIEGNVRLQVEALSRTSGCNHRRQRNRTSCIPGTN